MSTQFMMLDTRLVFFLHINKNWGSTTRDILRRNYPADAFLEAMIQGRRGVDGRAKTADGLDEDVHKILTGVQSRQQRLACASINLPFGVHKYLARPVTYFTFLREPVSRCISYWYFAYATRYTGSLWATLESYDFDLDRIFQSSAAYQFSNDQVRMVSGSSTPCPGEAELQLARENIEEHFALAGAVEYFAPCLKILAHQFGWKDAAYKKLNVGDKSDPRILPHQAEGRFREANEWDIRLYEWLVKNYLPRRLA